MKHTKLLFMAIAALFASSAMAETETSATGSMPDKSISGISYSMTIKGKGNKCGTMTTEGVKVSNSGSKDGIIPINVNEGYVITQIDFNGASNDDEKSIIYTAVKVDGDTLKGWTSVTLPGRGKKKENSATFSIKGINANKSIEIITNKYLPNDKGQMKENGDAASESVFEFTVTYGYAADNATLKSITINGEALNDFSSAKEAYDVELPFGTTDYPKIEAEANSDKATVKVGDFTPSNEGATFPAKVVIIVTAEDGKTTKTYTINFTVPSALSTDATLKTLTVDGKKITLAESTVVYTYEMPFLGKGLVAAVANDENATIAITQATEIPGDATVLVTAEDGTTTLAYTLSLTRKAGFEQVAVAKDTKWDWSKAGVSAIQYTATSTVTKSDTIVLANAMDSTWTKQIANSDDFNSQALRVVGEFMVRDGKYFQGPYISFDVEKAGTIKVVFSNTGNRESDALSRYLYVNGEKTKWGSWKSSENTTTDTIEVPAGKVELTFMLPDEAEGYQYARIYSIEYAVSAATAIDNTSSEVKAVKVLRNGQLLIQKGDKLYTAQGTVVE